MELDAEKALFVEASVDSPGTPELDGLAVTFYENERPLRGLVGLLDWRFHGAISDYVRAGAVSGKSGECVYLPIRSAGGHGEKVYHLILVGAGSASEPGARRKLSSEALQQLKKNLASLKLKKIGVSKQDFGGALPDGIEGWPLKVLR
jgi:hypothetical protein